MSELEKKLREFISNNSLSLSFTEQLSAIRNHFDGDNYSELQNFALNYSKSLSNDDPKKYESSCLARIFMSLNMASVQASLNDAFGDIPMVDTLALMDADKKSFYSMALGYFIKANDNASVLECQKNALDDGLSKEEVETILSNNGYGQKKNDLESAMNTLFTGMGMRPEDAAEMFAQFSDFLKQKNNSPRQNQRGVRPQVNKSNKSTLRSTDSNGYEFKNIVDGIMKANLKNTIDEELEMIMLFTEDFEGLHAYIVNKYINEMLKDEKSFTGLKVLAVLSALDGNEDKYYNNLLAYHLKACQRAYKDSDYDFVYAREKLISTLVEHCKQNNISDDEIKKIFEHYSFSEEFGSLSIDDIISCKVLEENDEEKDDSKSILGNAKEKVGSFIKDRKAKSNTNEVKISIDDMITQFLKSVPVEDNYEDAKRKYQDFFKGYKIKKHDFDSYDFKANGLDDDVFIYKLVMLESSISEWMATFYRYNLLFHVKNFADGKGNPSIQISNAIRKCLDAGISIESIISCINNNGVYQYFEKMLGGIVKEYHDRSYENICDYCSFGTKMEIKFDDELKKVQEFGFSLGDLIVREYYDCINGIRYEEKYNKNKLRALGAILHDDRSSYYIYFLQYYRELFENKNVDIAEVRDVVERIILDNYVEEKDIYRKFQGNPYLEKMLRELSEELNYQGDNKLVKSIDEFFGVRKIAKKIRRKFSNADASKVDEGIIRGCDDIVKSFDDVTPTPLVDEDDDKITIDQPSSLDQSSVGDVQPEPVKPQNNSEDDDFLFRFAVPIPPSPPQLTPDIANSFDDVTPPPLVDEDDDKITIDQPSSLDQSSVGDVQPEPVKPTPEPIKPSSLPWLSQEPEPVKPTPEPIEPSPLPWLSQEPEPVKPTPPQLPPDIANSSDDVTPPPLSDVGLQQELIPGIPTRQDAYRGVMNALGKPVENSEKFDHGRSR